jgi:hypothetical protein
MAIEFRCPQCQRLLQTPDSTAGKQAKCPDCGAICVIPAASVPPPESGPPIEPAPGQEGSPFAPGSQPGPAGAYQAVGGLPGDFGIWRQPDREYALARVNSPAVGLIVVGALGLVYTLAQVAPLVVQLGPRMQGDDLVALGAMGGFGVVALGASILIMIGGLKMKRLESYGWSRAACIMAMIPCLSPCCVLGLPFGIWGINVLSDPRVKSAFMS